MNPARPDGCPAIALLEGFVAGEESQLAPHLETCARCAQYVALLRGEAQAFLKARPPELFLRQLERREASAPTPRRRALMFAFAGLLTAAVSVFVVLRPSVPETNRLKGSALTVFLKRGSAPIVPLSMDQTLHAGDELRFAYRTTTRGVLTIFELDATESASVVFPATTLEVGDHVLPGAIALDGVAGPEWFVSVFSAEAYDVADVKRQLQGQANRAQLSVTCGSCVVESVRGNKSRSR